MTTKQSADLIIDRWSEKGLALVQDMGRYELDDLMESIVIRRNEIMAADLRRAGFGIRIRKDMPASAEINSHTIHFRYLCVYPPSEANCPGEWATHDECHKLLDTVRNFEPAEAFKRWSAKVSPMQEAPYTRADAERDMRAERAEIKRNLSDGKFDGEMAGIMLRQTSDYLKYAV